MVPEEYCGRPYLLKGGELRFRRDGKRIRIAASPVVFQPQDAGVDVALLLRQRQIVEAPDPPHRVKAAAATDEPKTEA